MRRIEPGNSQALSQAVASAPKGCVFEIEGVYVVSERWYLNIHLRSVDKGKNSELTEYGAFYFSMLDNVPIDGKTNYQAAVLSREGVQSIGFPSAVLIPSGKVAEHWLSLMPGGRLEGIGVISGSLSEIYGCFSTGIQISASVSDELQVGFPENSLPSLCHREHYQGSIFDNGQLPLKIVQNTNGSKKKAQGRNRSESSSSDNKGEAVVGTKRSRGSMVSSAGAAGDEDGDEDDKKNKSWAWIIAKLLEKHSKGLLLAEIYEGVKDSENVKKFKIKSKSKLSSESDKGWHNSVRHVLSVNKPIFQQNEDGGKRGHRWMVVKDWDKNRSDISGRVKRFKRLTPQVPVKQKSDSTTGTTAMLSYGGRGGYGQYQGEVRSMPGYHSVQSANSYYYPPVVGGAQESSGMMLTHPQLNAWGSELPGSSAAVSFGAPFTFGTASSGYRNPYTTPSLNVNPSVQSPVNSYNAAEREYSFHSLERWGGVW